MATDSVPQRQCCQCKQLLPATPDYFPKHAKKPYGVGYKCRECSRAYQRDFYHEKYADDPEYRERAKLRAQAWRDIPENAEHERQTHRDPAYRQRQRENHLLRMKNDPEYAERCKEKRRKYNHDSRIRIISDPERFAAYKAKLNIWCEKNHTSILKGQRDRYRNNPTRRQKVLDHQRERYHTDSEVRYQKHIAGIRRRARKANLPDTLTVFEWQRCLEYFDFKCAVCGKQPDMWCQLSADHWIAISDLSPDNPGTTALNIVPMCHCLKGAPDGTPSCNRSKSSKKAIDWLLQEYSPRQARKIIRRIEAYFEWVQGQIGRDGTDK